MNCKLALGGLLMAAIVPFASAQASSASFDSYDAFNFTLGANVSMSPDTNNASGSYTNGVVPTTTGDGVNSSPYTNLGYNAQLGYYSVEASATATTTANGTASQFIGAHYFFDFTNNGTVAENVIWNTEQIYQLFSASGNATAIGYTGWGYYDTVANQNYTNYCTNGLNGDGTSTGTDLFGYPFPDIVGYQLIYPNPSASQIFGYYDTHTATLAAGQTIAVQFWASGSVQAYSQAVPEPGVAWLIAAGLGILMFRRSRTF